MPSFEKALTPRTPRPALLVSVRNEQEARAAERGGADIIDVKNPSRGSLGAADAVVIAGVRRAVAAERPVTAAAGELAAAGLLHFDDFAGCDLVKLGVAGLADVPDWRASAERLALGPLTNRIVLVAYADWQAARAPEPERVLEAARQIGCRWGMVDTFDKSAGSSAETLGWTRLERLAVFCRLNRLQLALAGRLGLAEIGHAIDFGADVIAVRGAACGGDRLAEVSEDAVRRLVIRVHGKNALPVSSAASR
ncbi:MAG: (5-formylfuran-3-yl)methyl phosphate synthase [Planctomycetota bacterium]